MWFWTILARTVLSHHNDGDRSVYGFLQREERQREEGVQGQVENFDHMQKEGEAVLLRVEVIK